MKSNQPIEPFGLGIQVFKIQPNYKTRKQTHSPKEEKLKSPVIDQNEKQKNRKSCKLIHYLSTKIIDSQQKPERIQSKVRIPYQVQKQSKQEECPSEEIAEDIQVEEQKKEKPLNYDKEYQNIENQTKDSEQVVEFGEGVKFYHPVKVVQPTVVTKKPTDDKKKKQFLPKVSKHVQLPSTTTKKESPQIYTPKEEQPRSSGLISPISNQSKIPEVKSESRIEAKNSVKQEVRPEINKDIKSDTKFEVKSTEQKQDFKQDQRFDQRRSFEEQNILAMDYYKGPEEVYLEGNVEGYNMEESGLSFTLQEYINKDRDFENNRDLREELKQQEEFKYYYQDYHPSDGQVPIPVLQSVNYQQQLKLASEQQQFDTPQSQKNQQLPPKPNQKLYFPKTQDSGKLNKGKPFK